MSKISKNEPVIVQKGQAILRETARNIPVDQITLTEIQGIILDMKIALDSQDDGVAIAAPQIGVPLRIFVVSKKVQILMRGKDLSKEEISKLEDSVYINPEIKKLSRLKTRVDEGCLSIRYLYGKVERAEKATVTAYNEKGKKFTIGGSGLLAQIFQHEIDHLNGILFTDKANEVIEVLPEKNNNDK